jgi:hypothetical protein
MNYVGIDIHKHYSVLVAIDELRGDLIGRACVPAKATRQLAR